LAFPEITMRDTPFFYGYRYQATVDGRSRRRYKQVPLTREDVLHPQLDDKVFQNEDHDWDCAYLRNVLTARVAKEPRTIVRRDYLINWDVPGLRGHGPDIVLIRNVRPRRERRDSFDVAVEGVRPELIIEVTAPATRDLDLDDKRREYFQAGVPVYVIVDEELQEEQRHLLLLGYQAGMRRYRQMKLNRQGRLWLEAVKLWLGQEQGHVALYDEAGKRQLSYLELMQQIKQADANTRRADEEARRAEQEAERARQAEAELQRLRALLGQRDEEE
jgi:Uma2 family endonuclease